MAERSVRPKAWGVLAVSLALMALVTALSSTTGHRPGASAPAASRASATGRASRASSTQTTRPLAGTAARSATAIHRPTSKGPGRASRDAVSEPSRHDGGPDLQRAGATASPAPVAIHLASTPALGTHAANASGSPGAEGDAPGAGVRTSPVSPGAPSGTTRTAGAGGATTETLGSATAPGSPQGPTSATGAGRTAGPQHEGTLAFPVTSVTVGAPGGSTVNATATWRGTPTLELTITCPDGVSASRRGASGLSLEVDDTVGGPGQCDVVLSTPPGVRADVDFTLTVEPGA